MSGLARIVVLDPPGRPGDACRGCDGSGVSGERYEFTGATADGPPLLVDVLCRTCRGCGRAEHDDATCRAREHGLRGGGLDEDPDDAGDDDGGDEAGCFSCHGLSWWTCEGWHVDPVGEPTDDEVVQLRVPCGCTSGRVQVIDRATGEVVDEQVWS